MLRQNVNGRRHGSDKHNRRGDKHKHDDHHVDCQPQVNLVGRYNQAGNLLIADTFNNRVIETNPRGEIVWQYGNGPTALPTPGAPGAPPSVLPAGAIYGPRSVQRIGDLTLILTGGIDVDTVPTVPPGPGGPGPNFPLGIFDTRLIVVNEAKQIVFSYGEFGILANGTDQLTLPISAVYVPRAYSNRAPGFPLQQFGQQQLIQCRGRHHHHDSHSSSSSSSSSSSPSHHHHDRHHHQHGLNHLNGGHAAFDGTILIVDLGNPDGVPPVPARVIEINAAGQIVWQYPAGGAVQNPPFSPSFATRLTNGNTLIATETSTLIEINSAGRIVRTITATTLPGGPNILSGSISSAYLLPNGNLLVTDSGNNLVVEINRQNQIVWAYGTDNEPGSTANPSPRHAVRLANGDTLIADTFNNRVIRVNETGVIVQHYGAPVGVDTTPIDDFAGNSGYSPFTTQLGLFGPSDAKIIGDYTGQLDSGDHGHKDKHDSDSHDDRHYH